MNTGILGLYVLNLKPCSSKATESLKKEQDRLKSEMTLLTNTIIILSNHDQLTSGLKQFFSILLTVGLYRATNRLCWINCI